MHKVNSTVGLVGVLCVALANLSTTWAQSDEVPRRLRERISRTLIDEGFPSAASAFDTEVKITARDGAAGDSFGYSVSISGDTAIVGAYADQEEGEWSGSAYVYQRDKGGVDNWGKVTKITASDTAAGDFFGWSVSISGETAIVGAPGDNFGPGSAYVYQRDKGGVDNWGESTKLTTGDAMVGDFFGYSVSISGDTAVVGAYRDDDSGPRSGSAYVYQRDKGGSDNWGEVTQLTASDAAGFEEFGYSVSVSGDTVIVGAHTDNDNGLLSGSAYVYQRDKGGVDHWGEITKLTASDGTAGDVFGVSVCISGDAAIVGAHVDDDNGERSGSAYVYHRNEGGIDNWSEVNKLTASDAAAGDRFGVSVSISGNTAIVGAWLDNNNGFLSGSAYLYHRNEGGVDNWGEVTKLTASDAAAGDFFGYSVSISGDTAIVGAYGDDDDGDLSGSAYVYFERQPVAVPTVSEWGIWAMTLLLLAATIKFGQRRRVTR